MRDDTAADAAASRALVCAAGPADAVRPACRLPDAAPRLRGAAGALLRPPPCRAGRRRLDLRGRRSSRKARRRDSSACSEGTRLYPRGLVGPRGMIGKASANPAGVREALARARARRACARGWDGKDGSRSTRLEPDQASRAAPLVPGLALRRLKCVRTDPGFLPDG